MDNNLISTGNCGEYFVAAELERRGFTVALPLSNVKDFDLLAINRSTNKQVAIQVKTTKHRKREWVLSKKNETLIGENIFYIFVVLSGLDYPSYHIVPSSVVADYIIEDNLNWFNSLGRNGQKHNETSIRKFRDVDCHYLDNWNVLF